MCVDADNSPETATTIDAAWQALKHYESNYAQMTSDAF
jgi:hypothetical protein